MSFIPSLRDADLSGEAIRVIIGVYTSALRIIWLIFMAFSALGLILVLFIKELPTETYRVGRQGLADEE